jgi:hypothetical protein
VKLTGTSTPPSTGNGHRPQARPARPGHRMKHLPGGDTPMWVAAMMTLLLASSSATALPAEPSAPAEAPPRPAVSPAPAAAEILFASGFKTFRFHATGAWSTRMAPGWPSSRRNLRHGRAVQHAGGQGHEDGHQRLAEGHLQAEESERLSPRDWRGWRARDSSPPERRCRGRVGAHGGGPLPKPDFGSDQCYIDKSQPSRTTSPRI